MTISNDYNEKTTLTCINKSKWFIWL